MLSFHKKFLTLFAALQLLSSQVIAETTTHISYSYSYTGSGLAEEISAELERIQENAYAENKFFEFVNADLPDYTMYILYTLSDNNGETNPFITKVAYASGWTPAGIYEGLLDHIDSLQNYAMSENKIIHFLDIKVTPNGNAYIIYEISK